MELYRSSALPESLGDLQCALTSQVFKVDDFKVITCSVKKAPVSLLPGIKVSEKSTDFLFKTNAICRFIAKHAKPNPLVELKLSPQERVLNDELLDFCESFFTEAIETTNELYALRWLEERCPGSAVSFVVGKKARWVLSDVAIFSHMVYLLSDDEDEDGYPKPDFSKVDFKVFPKLLIWFKGTFEVLKNYLKDALLILGLSYRKFAIGVKPELQKLAKAEKKTKKRIKKKEETEVKFEFVRRPYKPGKPVHPVKGQRNILITSALPYVNNVPHLGNIIGCVLSADVYARFCRLQGYNVIYICGNDEYGTATETKALEEGLSPKEICDKYHAIHTDIYDWFDISFDKFGRTATEHQTKVAQDIFLKNDKNGNIVEEEIDTLYCSSCKRYLADRYVVGTCPKCGYEGARGDQCDLCGVLLNPIELVNAACKFCKKEPSPEKSKHLFLRLPKIAPSLEEWIKAASLKGFWTTNSLQTTNGWLRDGLKNRCISRDLKWGTPIPKKNYENKVFYVWFDAPIGYISITANYTDQWERWWKNPDDVELVQFMGKDNIPFHTVIFPSSLIGSKDNWTLLHHISTTEYLNYENSKFSKTYGQGVFGDDVKSTEIPSEVWRYYLLVNRPEQADTQFSWDDLRAKNNNELLANLGNFVHRVLLFCHDECGCETPIASLQNLEKSDIQYIDELNQNLKEYIENLEGVKLKDGLKTAMKMSQIGNTLWQQAKPWKLLKSSEAKQVNRGKTVIGICVRLTYLIATVFQPYMPSFTDKLCYFLNVDPNKLSLKGFDIFKCLKAGHKVSQSVPIFNEMSEKMVQTYRKRFAGVQGKREEEKSGDAKDFPLRLISAKVVEVKEHPKADKLYILKLQCGEAGGGERVVVSGLREHYKADELLNLNVVLLANLKSSNFKGIKSYGMILAASDSKGKYSVLSVPLDVETGTKIIPKGDTTKNFKQINFDAFKKLKIVIGKDEQPLFNEIPLVLEKGNQKIRPQRPVPQGSQIC